MQFSSAILLLLSTSLTYARVLSDGEPAESSPDYACHRIQQDGSASPKCQPATITSNAQSRAVPQRHNTSEPDAIAASRWKTVIPDLTAIGYEWDDQPDKSYLEYIPGLIIDELSVSEDTPSIIITQAYNQDLDSNPNKVPLRDILLSFWQYKKGKTVADLEFLLYQNVVEKNMVDMLPDIYALLGRNMDDDKKNLAHFSLRPSASGNEQNAYFKLLEGCPFPAGANKMLREYSDFGTRPLGDFEIWWMGGNSFNFVVSFFKV